LEKIELTVGYQDEEGNVHKFCTLTELTGEVEEKMADRKIADNMGKIVTVYLAGIMTSLEGIRKVTKEVLQKFSTIDRDFLTVMAYKVNHWDDPVIKWKHDCPVCNTPNDIKVDVDDINVKFMSIDEPRIFTRELIRGINYKDELHKSFSFVLPTGEMLERIFPITRQNPAYAQSVLMQMMVTKLGTLEMIPVEVFQKATKIDRDFIGKCVSELELGVDLGVVYSCSGCMKEHTVNVPVTALLGE
jgi:hypothetical protein